MHQFSSFAKSLGIAAVLAISAYGSDAGAASSVSGTWTSDPGVITSAYPAGNSGNYVVTVVGTSHYFGQVAGDTTYEMTIIYHSDGSYAGTVKETFTGSVNGASGTLEMRETVDSDVFGNLTFKVAFVNGGGGLQGRHGQATFVGTTNLDTSSQGTYTGTL